MFTKNKIAISLISNLCLLALFSPVALAATGSATIQWTSPTTNSDGSTLTDLAGHIVYYDTVSHAGHCPTFYGSASPYSSMMNVGNPSATSQTINGLTEGQTYYFAVVAYDTSHNLSACATVDGSGDREVSKVIPVSSSSSSSSDSGSSHHHKKSSHKHKKKKKKSTGISQINIPVVLTKARGAKVWWSVTSKKGISRYSYKWDSSVINTSVPSFFVPRNATGGTHKITIKVYNKTGKFRSKTIKIRVI